MPLNPRLSGEGLVALLQKFSAPCPDNSFKIWKVDKIAFSSQKNVVGGSSMIGFLLEIADSEWYMPGIHPVLLGWHTSALTTELQAG